MSKIHLTKNVVTSLEPKDKRYTISDKTLMGLQVHVTPSGTKTFYVRKRALGRTIKVRIGRFPDEVVSPTRARELALPIIADMSQGVDPNEDKRRARVQNTFASIYELFMDLHSRPTKKSWKQDESCYAHIPASLRSRSLKKVTPLDIKQLHKKIGDAVGRPMANKVLAFISAVYNYSIDELGMNIANPAARITKFPVRHRKVRLMPHQIPDFFKAVASLREAQSPTADYVLLLLYTGARKSNVGEMMWDELDFENNIWNIPDTKVKNGDDLIIPLIPEAVKIIKGCPRLKGNPYVFPASQKEGGPRCQTAHWKQWLRVRSELSIENITFHDLRRSHGSWMADIGTSKDLLKAALGHKSDSANNVYTHVDVEPVRKAKEATVAKILEFRKAG